MSENNEIEMELPFDSSAITSTEVLDRVNALLTLQDTQNELTEQMEKEILEIEKKYLKKFQPLAEKRFEIVSGKVEPTKEDQQCKAPIQVENLKSVPTDKGIPKFWLHVLQNTEVKDIIEECDIEALEYLVDIKIVQVGDAQDYSLDFHFSENPFFTNTVISKTVKLEEDNELNEIVSTPINWKDGKNFTVQSKKKTVKSKPTKGKAATTTSTTVQEVVPCFFSTFISPNQDPTSDEEADEVMYIQYQIIAKLKDIVIPEAVNFFLGRASDAEENDYDFGEDFEDEEGEDDEEDEDDEEEQTIKKPSGKGKAQPQNPDCKQQ
ncbi:hypothetical protein ACTFIY_011539 [Dictyostelium cf. discoideum]